MLTTTHQLPTLGYMHKVLCDSLGLWNSDNEDIKFNLTATEKERRAALRQAFAEIKKANGTYGSYDELTAITTQIAPTGTQKIKKSRTIQSYVNHISKADFESFDEYEELCQYVEVLLTERYSSWGVSKLAVCFYVSAMAYYREFVRENACNKQDQMHSFQSFLSQDLRLLTGALIREQLPDDTWPDTAVDNSWPLKEFADTASSITCISLHKLHQYHEFQQERPLNEQAWACDFTSQQVNTRSKQVIDRLRKNSRMKWETFYPTLQPLTYHLPENIKKESFDLHAFAAMITHNLNIQVADYGPFEPVSRRWKILGQIEQLSSKPSSDLLDVLCNDYLVDHEKPSQMARKAYQALLSGIGALPGSLNQSIDIPNCLALTYNKEHRRFIEEVWQGALISGPNWLNEWVRAREALLAGEAELALSHFIAALEQAKYVAGPLFIPFYIQLCAFTKSQYRLHSERNEVELFDRFYEGLGSNAASYARLIGYAPQYRRDPRTLIPHAALPLKSKLIIMEIDELVKNWRS
ncbi:hypothetical protein [Aeromonas rivipollensis]|uniref:hypothetical protein n=1 Tax=Aeromonas rivipollensis TaxID=948519 RepID=UPI002978F7A2|nr:hypothetical protein [Aeromonas rivipollensis]